MKKLLLVSIATFSFTQELDNYLSPLNNQLFELELHKSLTQKNMNKLSWVSPITLSFERSWSNQIADGWHPSNRYSIGIDQPIFKSGGIYYGIKFAKSNYNLSSATILDKKVKLNTQAAQLLFSIKQTKLNISKLKLQIKNSKIELQKAKELFNAGLYGSEILDSAIVKDDEANMALLKLQETIEDLKSAFRKISNKNIDTTPLPKLRVLSKDEFLLNNTELNIVNAKSQSSKNYAKVVKSKYLPTVSVGARYSKISQAQKGTKDAFTNYNLRVTMPISVNTMNDLEIAKLDSMIDSIKAQNSRKSMRIEYNNIIKRVTIINKRINLASKELLSYRRLFKSTKGLYHAGQKSILDVDLIKNSMRIKALDIKIYKTQKSLELLKLYSKVNI